MTLGGSSGTWSAAASATRSNVQYNPAGDTRQRIRTSSLEIAFLGNTVQKHFLEFMIRLSNHFNIFEYCPLNVFLIETLILVSSPKNINVNIKKDVAYLLL